MIGLGSRLLRERGEVGEVGGVAKGGLHGEREVLRGGETVAEPIGFGGVKNAREIEEEGFGRGEFEVGCEAFDEGEDFVSAGDLGFFVRLQHEEIGTTGKCAGGAQAGEKSVLPGCGVDFEEGGFFAFALGEKNGGLLGCDAIAREEAVQRKGREVEAREHGGITARRVERRIFPAS